MADTQPERRGCSTPHMEVLLKANCFRPFWWVMSFDTLVLISKIKHYYKYTVLISNLLKNLQMDKGLAFNRLIKENIVKNYYWKIKI